MTEYEPTPLQSMANEHHEVFQAWLLAGFTESQALQLLANYMVANARSLEGPDDGA